MSDKTDFYQYIPKEVIMQGLRKAYRDNDAPGWVWHLVMDSFDNPFYNWKTYNGCNVIDDPYHPFPPCWIHDYIWGAGMASFKSEILFYKMLVMFGYSKRVAFLMALATTLKMVFVHWWTRPFWNDNTVSLEYAYRKM